MSWSADLIQWDIIFHRALQDWELDILAEFLTLLYSIRVTRDVADNIGWRPTWDRLFEVKSFYTVLHAWGTLHFLGKVYGRLEFQ